MNNQDETIPTASHLVLGTAGHIDHGKTALVKRLTGVDCDRLDEEKRRGITIELGFAPWQLTGPNGETLQASIIDVPGHERLVRTMVAGAGGMDLAMLVVAADDGVMPQTREHLDVLCLLGVPAGLVVLTKCDLVDDDELLELVEQDVGETVADTLFADAPIIRTSSKRGDGIDELAAAVYQIATKLQRRTAIGPAFLPLDRVFTKAGYGTVGTGTTLRGQLATGDTVEVFGADPTPIGNLKVRGLQALGAERERVSAGMRTAVNLAGKTDGIKKGMVIATAGTFLAVESCIAWLRVLPGARGLAEEILITHAGTTERETRVLPLGTKQLEPGEQGGCLLRFERPLALYAGQRIVLRRPGVHGQATVAGGEVLDPEPPRGKGAVALASSQLERLRGTVKDRLLAVAIESRAEGVSLTAISRRLPPGEGERTARHLAKKGKLVTVPGKVERWIDSALAEHLVNKLVAMVAHHHDNSPMSAGLPEPEIESQLPPPERHLAGIMVERAVSQKKLVRDGALLAVPGCGSSVDAAAAEEMKNIRSLYRRAGHTPPSDSEVQQQLGLTPRRLAELLSLLRRQKGLVKVTDGMHYDPGAIAQIEERVVAALGDGKKLTASELKDALGGLTRKYTIPLLEYLDRQRVTLRQGNVRALYPTRSAER